jgi:hypothetical protein
MSYPYYSRYHEIYGDRETYVDHETYHQTYLYYETRPVEQDNIIEPPPPELLSHPIPDTELVSAIPGTQSRTSQNGRVEKPYSVRQHHVLARMSKHKPAHNVRQHRTSARMREHSPPRSEYQHHVFTNLSDYSPPHNLHQHHVSMSPSGNNQPYNLYQHHVSTNLSDNSPSHSIHQRHIFTNLSDNSPSHHVRQHHTLNNHKEEKTTVGVQSRRDGKVPSHAIRILVGSRSTLRWWRPAAGAEKMVTSMHRHTASQYSVSTTREG